jgi:hypothetical protein
MMTGAGCARLEPASPRLPRCCRALRHPSRRYLSRSARCGQDQERGCRDGHPDAATGTTSPCVRARGAARLSRRGRRFVSHRFVRNSRGTKGDRHLGKRDGGIQQLELPRRPSRLPVHAPRSILLQRGERLLAQTLKKSMCVQRRYRREIRQTAMAHVRTPQIPTAWQDRKKCQEKRGYEGCEGQPHERHGTRSQLIEMDLFRRPHSEETCEQDGVSRKKQACLRVSEIHLAFKVIHRPP